MRAAVWIIAALGLSAAPMAQAAECAPARMVRVVIQNALPGLPASSPQAKPRTMYRHTERYARIEEPMDPTSKRKLLVIVAEPDVWMIDEVAKKGQRAKDPGPVYEFRAPILSPDRVPELFQKLETGCELDFVTDYAPRSVGKVKIDKRTYDQRQVIMGPLRLEFLLNEAGDQVFQVALYRNERPEVMLRYLDYNAQLPPDMALFAPPPGVWISDATPPPAKR